MKNIFRPSRHRLLACGCSLAALGLQAQTGGTIAGFYSVSETMTLTVVSRGQTETETLRGPSQSIAITQSGNTLSYSVTDPSSGLTAGRTLTLSGSSIVAMSGPAVVFRTAPGFSTSQNTITSVTGTATPGRIDITMRGRVVGVIDGVAFTMDVTSTAVFSNPSLVPAAPTISSTPTSQTVSTGARATFSVSAGGTAPLAYQWRKDGTAIAGATGASYVIASAQAGDAGGYSVVITNSLGTATSGVATLTIATPPVFAGQPRSVTSRVGSTVALAVSATGAAPLTYQWRKNAVNIVGATTSALVLNAVSATDAAAYTTVVSNSLGSLTSVGATVTVLPAAGLAPSRLANLSVRSVAGAGNQTLIVGFVAGGGGTIGSKPILVRGIGPTLGVFGVADTLADPRLALFSGTTTLVANDDWGGDAQVAAIGAQVGAFAIPSAASRDAAFYRPAQAAGAYSVQVTGNGGATGVALAEIYDTTPGDGFTVTTPRLVNVSARTQVGAGGEILITGFVIAGPTAQTVLVRGVGPSLSAFGVGGVLVDPKLDLFQDSTRIAENDNWGGLTTLSAVFTRVGAFNLSGTASRDAALLITLPPGAYTAQVSGVGGTTGVALVEVYEVP